MIEPSCERGPRTVPLRLGARNPRSRINRSTRAWLERTSEIVSTEMPLSLVCGDGRRTACRQGRFDPGSDRGSSSRRCHAFIGWPLTFHSEIPELFECNNGALTSIARSLSYINILVASRAKETDIPAEDLTRTR